MKVKELIKDFEGERRPYVAAAAFLGVHPRTISVWEEKKGGVVPEQWAALYREKKQKAACGGAV
jgi:DNA-binding transcriptional MerR regulator